jgi:NADH-quinone oxidoreductase subunit N
VTAFLSVASKAAGFVALMELVFIAFLGRGNVWGPTFWILAALTMTVGNLVALRQTNIVRMLAYSSIAQAGFILVPFAVAGERLRAEKAAFTSVVLYLLIYAIMNLGAFTVVIAVARKTRSGEISSYGGLFNYAPAMTVVMTLFMASLAGIPPLAGFWAKFFVFRSIAQAGSAWPWILGAIAAVNSVIAFYYYAGILKEMWFKPVPDGDTTQIRVPASLQAGLVLTAVGVVAVGLFPSLLTRFGDLAKFLR